MPLPASTRRRIEANSLLPRPHFPSEIVPYVRGSTIVRGSPTKNFCELAKIFCVLTIPSPNSLSAPTLDAGHFGECNHLEFICAVRRCIGNYPPAMVEYWSKSFYSLDQ